MLSCICVRVGAWCSDVECMVSRCGDVDVNWCSVTVSYGAGGLSGHLAIPAPLGKLLA